MSDKEIPEVQNIDKIDSILNEIKKKGELLGVIISYRDGGLITENYGKEFDSNTFTAMCASIIGGAEGLGQTIGEKSFRKIITELEDKSIVMVDCGDRAILTLIIEKTSSGGTLLDEIDDYIQKIINLIK